MKYLRMMITVPLLLAVLMSLLLLFTHAGNAWLWTVITQQLAPLEGELVAGELLSGWTFKNFRWQDETITFNAETLVLKWNPVQLINRQLPIDLLDVEKAQLTLRSDAKTKAQPPEQTAESLPLSIPVDIFLREIRLKEISLSTEEANVTLATLTASAELLNNHLTIHQFLADQLHLQITDTHKNAHKKSEKEDAKRPILPLLPPGFQLPDITLPLPVTLKQLTLTNGLYRQGEQEETIKRVSLKFHGQKSAIDDIELIVNHRLAEASLTGNIHFDKAWPLDAVIQARITDAWDIPEFQGLAGEQVSLHASGDLNRLNLTLTTQGAITSSLRGHISPLGPTLPFDLNLEWQALQWPLVAEQPEMHVSDGHINLTGSLEQYQMNLQTRLALPEQPEIDVTLSALGTLTQLNISALKIQPTTDDAISSDNALDVAGILKWQQGIHWQGHATVTRFTPEVWLPQVSGVIDGKLAISFALDDDQWRLKIPELSLTGSINDVPLDVKTDLEASSALSAAPLPQHLTIRNFSVALGDNRFTINGTIDKELSLAANVDIPAPEQFYPGLKGKLTGTVNLAGRYQHPTLAFHLDSSSLAFPLQSDDDIIWKGMLSGTGDIRWQHKTPIVNLDVQFPPGKLETGDVALNYQQLALSLNLDENQFKGRVDMASKQLGIAHIDLAVADIQTDQQLSGAFQLKDLQLNLLAPFVPQLTSLEGTLAADTTMGGTLKKPLLFGELSLSDGQLTARGDMVKVTHLGTRLAVDGSRGELSGSLKVGEGEMKLAGHLDWQELPVTGLITMKGERLQAKVPGIVQLQASPDLQLTLGDTQKLTGIIAIPEARITVKELPKQAITPSDDVVIVTSDTDPEVVTGSTSQFTMDVSVVLGSDIKIDAYGLKADLDGQLLLELEPGKTLTANGSVQLLEGRYKQFGQDLLIKEGNIILSGPLTSPYLSVNAFRNPNSVEDGVLVGIELEGSLANPEFTIYSDPAMEQQEQWSYLLRGRGLKLSEEGDDFAIQSLLLGFGVGQIGGIVSTMGEAIGLSDVTLDTEGSGEDTQVVIGGNINRHLQVQYGAGVFNSIASLKVRYELMPRLYLQVVSGIAQTLDLLYQFKVEAGTE